MNKDDYKTSRELARKIVEMAKAGSSFAVRDDWNIVWPEPPEPDGRNRSPEVVAE